MKRNSFSFIVLIAVMLFFSGFASDAVAQNTTTLGGNIAVSGQALGNGSIIDLAGFELDVDQLAFSDGPEIDTVIVKGTGTLTFSVAAMTVDSIHVTGGNLIITNTNAFTVTKGIEVDATRQVNLTTTGAVTADWLIGAAGIIDTDAVVTLTGDVVLAGAATFDLEDASDVTISGDVSNLAASTVTITEEGSNGGNGGTTELTLTGTITLGADLTFDQTDAANATLNVAAVTALTSTADAEFIAGAAEAWTGITTIGGTATDTLMFGGATNQTAIAAGAGAATVGNLSFGAGAGNKTFGDALTIASGHKVTVNGGGVVTFDAIVINGELQMDIIGGVYTAGTITLNGGGTLDCNVTDSFAATPSMVVGGTGTATLDVKTGATLTITTTATTIAAGATLSFTGGGAIAGTTGHDFTLAGATSTLHVASTSTITGFGDIITTGGTLDIDADATFTTTVLTGGGVIDVADGEVFEPTSDPLVIPDNAAVWDLELKGTGSINGTAIDIGTGGANGASLTLTDAMLATSIGDIDITGTGDNCVINVDADNTTTDLVITNGVEIAFGGATLTSTAGVVVAKPVILSGNSTGIMAGGDWDMNAGGSITCTNFASPTLSANLDIAAASVTTTKPMTISGDITLTGAATFNLRSNLTYTGAAIDVKNFDVTFDDRGIFVNSSSELTMSGTGGVGQIFFTGPATVNEIEVTDLVTDSEINVNTGVDSTATIEVLTITADANLVTGFNADLEKLTFANGLTIPDASTYTITDEGTAGFHNTIVGNMAVTGAGANLTSAGNSVLYYSGNVTLGNAAAEATFTLFAADSITGTITNGTGLRGKLVLGAAAYVDSTVTINGSMEINNTAAATIAASIVMNSDSVITLNNAGVLTYTGPAFTANTDSLVFSGAGSFVNNSSNSISIPDATVYFSGAATVSDLTMTDADALLVVDGANATIDSLNVLQTGFGVTFNTVNVLSINSDITLGDAGVLQINAGSGGTIAGSGVLSVTGAAAKVVNKASGATISQNITLGNATTAAILDVDESLNLSGTITLDGLATIDIATGKTQTYNSTALDIEAGENLTIMGGGTLNNTNAITLSDPTSEFIFGTDGGTVSAVTMDTVATVVMNGGDATITTLTLWDSLAYITLNDEDATLTITNAQSMDAVAGEWTVTATEDGIIDFTNGLDLGGATNNKFNVVNNGGVPTVTGAITLGEATLATADSIIVTGDAAFTTSIDATDDYAVIILNSTATYSGAAISIAAGEFLYFEGAGTFDNTTAGGVTLATSTSTLMLSGTNTIGAVVSSDNAGKINLMGSTGGTTGIDTLTYAATMGVNVYFDTTKTLNIGSTTSPLGVFLVDGAADKSGTITGDTLDLATDGETITVNTIDDLTVGNIINLGAGTIDFNVDGAVSGNIVAGAAGTIDVLTAKRVYYTGDDIHVGAFTLTAAGAGIFYNDVDGSVVIDSSTSVLDFTGAGNVNYVTSGDEAATIDGTAAGTVGNLDFEAAGDGVTFDLATGVTLTVDTTADVGDYATVTIQGTNGTLAGADTMYFNGLGSMLSYTFTTTANTVAKSFGFGNDTTADTLRVVEGKNVAAWSGDMVFAGATLIDNGGTIALTGDLGTTAASVVSDADSGNAITATGGMNLKGDLTIDTKDFVLDGVTSLTAGANSTLDIDTTDFSNVTSLGTNLYNITINSSYVKTLFTFDQAALAAQAGSITLAGDDTLYFKDLTDVDMNMVMNGTGRLLIEPAVAGLTVSDTLEAVSGILEIDSVGTSVQGDIDLDVVGVYKVSGADGILVLPRTKTSTLASADDCFISVTAGQLNGSGVIEEGAEQHTIATDGAASDLMAAVVPSTGGTFNNIAFDDDVIAFTAKGINVDGYAITVYVDAVLGDDTTGDGSQDTPFKTIAKAVSEAVEQGNVAVAAGTYTLDATVDLPMSINFLGKNLDTDNPAYTGGALLDESPTITFGGTAGNAMFNISAGESSFKGFKFVSGDAGAVFTFSDTNGVIEDLDFQYNKFTMGAGASVFMLSDSTGVDDFTVDANTFKGDALGYYYMYVDAVDTTVTDLNITSNYFENGTAYVALGIGDVSDIAVTSNAFMNGNGLLLSAADANTGTFEDVDMTLNSFKGDMDFALALDANLVVADFENDVNTDVMFGGSTANKNQVFFFATGTYPAVTNGVSDAAVAVDSVDATYNWWADPAGPNMAGADVSANVEYAPFQLVPTLAGGDIVITGVNGDQKAGTAIAVTVFAGDDGTIDFTANFPFDEVPGPKVVADDAQDAIADQTYLIVPRNTEVVANAKITVYNTDNGDWNASTNEFTLNPITTADINAITSLDVTDVPNDQGGYVMLSFTPSLNHPGYTTLNGYVGDDLPIDYYQVYRSTTDDFATAINWAVIAATAKAAGQGDTFMAVVPTNGDYLLAYYWVGAVRGDLPPPIGTGDSDIAGKVAKGVVAGYLIESVEVDVEAAVSSTADRLVSGIVGPDKSLAPLNDPNLPADANGDGKVDISDLGYFADFYGVGSEYDQLFDYDLDGSVNLLDLAIMANQWGTGSGKEGVVYTSGMNINTRFEMKPTMDFTSEYLTVEIFAKDARSLGGYAFDMIYDKSVFEFVDAADCGLLEEKDGNAPLFLKKTGDDRVTLANVITGMNKDVTIEGEGLVARLTFRWIGDKNADITLDNINVIDHNRRLNTLAKSVNENAIPLPDKFDLKQNYPNPFNPETTIRFELPETERVRIDIYNVLGQKVRSLVDAEFKAGVREVKWNSVNDYGVRVSSGMYIYRIVSGSNVKTKKMMLLK